MTALELQQNLRPEPADELSAKLLSLREDGKHLTFNDLYSVWRRILGAYYNHDRAPKDRHPLTAAEYFRPNAVRHIAASLLFTEGVPVELASQILGHSTTLMTVYYTHFTVDGRLKGMKALEAALDKEPQTPKINI